MLPVLEAPQVRPPARDRRSTWAHRITVSMMRLAILAAIFGIISGAYYLAKRGFGREWRSRVVEELHKRGVEAYIGRLTLDPFRGLVARNVRIFDYKNRENTLALISEVSLDINYAALIHHQPFLNALDVRDAQITFPLKTADGKNDKARELPAVAFDFTRRMAKTVVDRAARVERIAKDQVPCRGPIVADKVQRRHRENRKGAC